MRNMELFKEKLHLFILSNDRSPNSEIRLLLSIAIYSSKDDHSEKDGFKRSVVCLSLDSFWNFEWQKPPPKQGTPKNNMK